MFRVGDDARPVVTGIARLLVVGLLVYVILSRDWQGLVYLLVLFLFLRATGAHEVD